MEPLTLNSSGEIPKEIQKTFGQPFSIKEEDQAWGMVDNLHYLLPLNIFITKKPAFKKNQANKVIIKAIRGIRTIISIKPVNPYVGLLLKFTGTTPDKFKIAPIIPKGK